MTFFYPAILLGMLAAFVPILIHLLNLRKTEKIDFSSLLFLKKLEKSKIRRIKLKQLILLALRVIIILLLVAAFARPTIKKASASGFGSAKATVVFILDNSFSMSLTGKNGSNFSRLKNITSKIINGLNSGDEIFLVTTSGAKYGKFTSKNQSLKYLSLIKQSAIVLPINTLFKKALTLLSKTPNINKEIFVVSDFQENIFNEPLKKLPSVKASIYLVKLPMPKITNVSLSNFTLENKILTIGKPLNFNAKLFNGNNGFSSDNLLSLFLNGKKVAIKNIRGFSNSITIKSKTTLKKGGFTSVKAVIQEDGFNYDNSNFICFYVPEKINVLAISNNTKDIRFIKYALNSISNKIISLDEVKFNQFNSVNLSKYRTLIIIGSSDVLSFKRINNYLKNGGGIILMPSSSETLSSFNLLLNNLNIVKSGALIDGKGSNINVFGKVDFNSPIFYGLFENNKKHFLESPQIYRYFKIIPHGNIRPIISLGDGSIFLGEVINKNKRILIYSSAPVLNWGTFPLKNFFAPIIVKSILYISSSFKNKKPILPNDGLNINIGKALLPEVTIVRPDGTTDRINLPKINRRYFHYSKTNLTGVYKILSGNKLIDWAAVNPNPQESKFSAINLFKFKRALNNFGNAYILKNLNNIKQELTNIRLGVELWKYFLLLALFFFAIESFLSKSSKKDIEQIKEYLK